MFSDTPSARAAWPSRPAFRHAPLGELVLVEGVAVSARLRTARVSVDSDGDSGPCLLLVTDVSRR